MKLHTTRILGPFEVDLTPIIRKYGGYEGPDGVKLTYNEYDQTRPSFIAALEFLTRIAEQHDQLLLALKKHGAHGVNCLGAISSDKRPCTCGLADVIAANENVSANGTEESGT